MNLGTTKFEVKLWIVWLKLEKTCTKEMQKSKRTKNQHQKRLKTSFLDAARTNNLIFLKKKNELIYINSSISIELVSGFYSDK